MAQSQRIYHQEDATLPATDTIGMAPPPRPMLETSQERTMLQRRAGWTCPTAARPKPPPYGLAPCHTSLRCTQCNAARPDGTTPCTRCHKDTEGRPVHPTQCGICGHINILPDSIAPLGTYTCECCEATLDLKWECGSCQHTNYKPYTRCSKCNIHRHKRPTWACHTTPCIPPPGVPPTMHHDHHL